jgi:hypothetical protein
MVYSLTAVSAAACLVSAMVATAAAGTYEYGDYKVYNTRQVSEKELMCAGAPGKPYVHYVPCEAGYHCVEKSSYAPGEWGRYCLPIPKDYYAGKCYKTGERCMGAEGKPYVEYLPCCIKGDVCREHSPKETGNGNDSSWGSFCVAYDGAGEPDYKKAYETEKEQDTKTQYDVKYYDYKCHITGSKCGGAPGFPYVEYGNGCCSSTESCVPDAYMGWGKFCKSHDEIYSDYEKYKEDPKSYDPPAPKLKSWYKAPTNANKVEQEVFNPYAPKVEQEVSNPYAPKVAASPEYV